ncbi:MAG TPA: PAS domain-containing protein [Actinomycetota bacterium]|nr:PAS domain-containing protein [Actinomycetota bacterium]
MIRGGGRGSPDLHPEAYRALVEGAPVILYIDRPDELSTNLYTSPQIVDLLGFSVEEWMEDAELWVRRLHPDDRDRVVREHRASNERGERFLEEYRFVAKDDREVWIRDEAVPVKADDGTILYWRGVMVDITALKIAEERLRASLDEVRRMMAQRRELAQLLENAQEEERRRIAADMHDDPIQVMSAVDMRLQLLLDHPERVDPHELGQLAEDLRTAIDRLRNLLFELRPVALELEGLVPAISRYLEHAAKETGWTWTVTGDLATEPSPEARVTLYRIAQEAIGNARKHAGATRVDVRVATAEGGVALRITDDGRGFDPAAEPEPGHLGLSTIVERVQLAGGRFSIRSEPGSGADLACWLPPSSAPDDLEPP